MSEPGELSDPDSVITVLNEMPTLSFSLAGLTLYEVVICALTNTRCGINVTVNQTTDEDGKQTCTHTAHVYTITDFCIRVVMIINPNNLYIALL